MTVFPAFTRSAFLGAALVLSTFATGCPGEEIDGGPSPDAPAPETAEPEGDAGANEPDPAPEDDAGVNEPEPAPEGDAGANEPDPTPEGDAGANEPDPAPEGDGGVNEPDVGPDADGGVNEPDPTPEGDAGVPTDGGPAADGGAPEPEQDAGTPVDFGLDERPANPTCLAPDRPPSGANLALTRVFPGLTFGQAIDLLQAPGDDSAFYVVIKQGTVERFTNTNDASTSETFLDVSDRIIAPGGNDERGLLGLAFHPDFPTVSELYIHTIRRVGNPTFSMIHRVPVVGGVADVDNEEEILRIQQPFGNHNGGDLKFGPDGYLYGAVGDGGSAGDPLGNGQNTNTLLGIIFRIDIDSPPDPGLDYAIPADNPFADGVDGRPEIYAYGLRNPWRMSFDPLTGDLWAADVGQNAYEEVNVIENGGNYGWPIMEGFHCYNAATCDMAPYQLPATEYPHAVGRSITGGFVYRGGAIPGLEGVFVYGDFVTGRLFGAFPDADGGYENVDLGIPTENVASFGVDQSGAIYVLTYFSGIFRIDADGSTPPTPLPATLSATGCVNPSNPTELAAGVIPYDVNVPFWSDGAAKERAFAIPDGETITVGSDGDFDLPIGSVTIKTFFRAGERIETRLLVRHDDGGWGGYVYRWRADQSDADLLETALVDDAPGGAWNFPGRGTCLQCHTAAAGRTLGLTAPQLGNAVTYPQTGRLADQLSTLAEVGLINAAPTSVDFLADPFGAAPVNDRARAYLDVNCAACHQPGGPVQVDIDLRATVTTEEMDVCHQFPEAGDLGIDNGRLIDPGSPETSILFERMGRRDAQGMPPLASLISDVQGQALIGEWLNTNVCDGIDRPEPPAEPGTCVEPTNVNVGAGLVIEESTVGLENNESGSCGGGDTPEWVFEVVADGSGPICVDTIGSAYDTLIYARGGSCAGLELGCNDDIEFGVNTRSRLQLDVTGGEPVVVFVDGYSSAGAFTLNIAPGNCP